MYTTPPLGVYSRFGPFPDTIAGRDQFIAAFAQRIVLAGWIPRALQSYFDFNVGTTTPVSAITFLNCGSANDGNWAIFDNINHTKAYVIDKYCDSGTTPSCLDSKMACLKPGAFDGTFTSVGYVETGGGAGTPQFNGVVAALQKLGYVVEVTGSMSGRVKSGTVINGNLSISGGTNTLESSPDGGTFLNGGYIFRCRANMKTAYKSGGSKTYGLNNDLEILLFQSTRGSGSTTLRAAAARRFFTYPVDQTIASGGAITINGPADGSPDIYRSDYASPMRVDIDPWTFYANPYLVISFADTTVSPRRSQILAGALKLLDERKLDTQDLPFDELTFASLNADDANRHWGAQGWCGTKSRVAVRTNYGYYKIRYKAASSLAQAGQLQLYSYLPGRNGAISPSVDGPWAAGFREASEPWVGWGMTGEGPSDLTIVGGQLPDCFVIHEDTIDPVGSPIFQSDGQYFKKITKRASSGSNQDPFTLIARVTVVV